MTVSRGSYKRVSQPDGGAMVQLKGLGYSLGQIGKKLGYSRSTIQYYLKKYESMPRCMAAVIESQGGHTKY